MKKCNLLPRSLVEILLTRLKINKDLMDLSESNLANLFYIIYHLPTENDKKAASFNDLCTYINNAPVATTFSLSSIKKILLATIRFDLTKTTFMRYFEVTILKNVNKNTTDDLAMILKAYARKDAGSVIFIETLFNLIYKDKTNLSKKGTMDLISVAFAPFLQRAEFNNLIFEEYFADITDDLMKEINDLNTIEALNVLRFLALKAGYNKKLYYQLLTAKLLKNLYELDPFQRVRLIKTLAFTGYDSKEVWPKLYEIMRFITISLANSLFVKSEL